MYTDISANTSNSLLSGYDTIPIILTVPELASILRIGKNTAYELVRSNQIRAIRTAHSIRVPKDALIEYIGKAS